MGRLYNLQSSRTQRKKNLQKIFLGLIGIISLFALLTYLGPSLLVKFSLFLTNLQGETFPLSNGDTTVPFPPMLESIPSATNSASISIRGYAEAGSNIKLYVNNKLRKKVLAGKEGSFLIADVYLNEGENVITAIAEDAASNESRASDPLSVYFTKVEPLLEINSPSEDEEFTKKEIEISGKTDPEALLTINERQIILQKDGSFRHTFFLSEGENKITIVAQNKAGNKREKNFVVFFNPESS